MARLVRAMTGRRHCPCVSTFVQLAVVVTPKAVLPRHHALREDGSRLLSVSQLQTHPRRYPLFDDGPAKPSRARKAAARFTTVRARSTTGTSIIAPSNWTAPSPAA